MSKDLARLLTTARQWRDMYRNCQASGLQKYVTGHELGDIVSLFQAAEPYASHIMDTVEFYSKLNVSKHRRPVDRVVRDLTKLVWELEWSYGPGGGGWGRHTFSAVDPEPEREPHWRLM